MSGSHSDHGSVLGPREAALVVDENGELSFRMPEYGDDEQVPEMVQLLAAVLLRSRDDDWRAEMIETLNE
jgi:hypothetical protein